MMKIKNILLLAVLFVGMTTYAQDNILLERDFWKTKPDVATVKAKITEGNDPDQLNAYNFDPVVYAILEDTPNETIQYLISLDGNGVNKLTHDGRTYIFWAAYKGNNELMIQLITQGAKTDIVDDHGSTILNFAATTGQQNTKVFDICLANGANLKKDLNHDGANALLLTAPHNKDFKVVDYFVSKGLDINSTDAEGNSLFNYIAKAGNIELSKKALTKGIKGDDNAFLFAARGMRGGTTSLKYYQYLESIGLSPKTADNNKVTPLHILAARNKDLTTLQYFIDKGLDVNAKDNEGNTPFINAARSNNIEVLTLLSKYNKDISLANKNGETALLLAVASNSEDVVEFLIHNNGADRLNAKDSKGNNIAYYLVQSYNQQSPKAFQNKAKLLAHKGIDLTKTQGNGNNLYHLAAEKNSLTLLEWANNYYGDINTKNSEGYTPLHLAAMIAKNDEVLKYLIKLGADKKAITDFEETAFDLASENEILINNKTGIEFLK
ncbi:ankyrin repeat domain-containing protein [Galbibacter sp. EGI 63066]|uniref:ankyrin repeat domain-containing protein n=1 Tax=Galbibacter sp. EGI 63066 TaxID=2993559 RepID=UPI0022499E31|nr:ankyrin repeat domain-containing protein [Galbibacter sp. EGI 63066]MCX2681859.1 ankyrin repeat domain-containing protein [Galbibacter sp. EGI 63066]